MFYYDSPKPRRQGGKREKGDISRIGGGEEGEVDGVVKRTWRTGMKETPEVQGAKLMRSALACAHAATTTTTTTTATATPAAAATTTSTTRMYD